jgi:hypothetical protein
MNFQRLFGPLTRPSEDKFFDDIIGEELEKEITKRVVDVLNE